MNRPQTNKIRLTDLCPQEKAKIGQLIKSLESVKSQNGILNEQINSLKITIANLNLQIQNMKSRLVEETVNNQNNRKEISLLKQYQEEQQKQIAQMKTHQQQSLIKEIVTLSIGMNTDCILTSNATIQTSSKHKKQKNKLIQTEYELQPKGHTKSFERIMNTNVEPISKNSSKQKIKHVSQFQSQMNKQLQKNQEEYESEEDYDELAKKWLQLKQRNINKAKTQYRNTIEQIDEQGLKEKPEEVQLHTYSEDFDEIQLNRILKSDNFRASRLMRQNESPLKNTRSISKNQNSKVIYNKSRTVDFYQTDLLDLVAEIDKQK